MTTHVQAITHVGIPDAIHSDAWWRALTSEIIRLGQVPESAPQVTLVPDWSDQIGFADGQAYTNGSRLDTVSEGSGSTVNTA